MSRVGINPVAVPKGVDVSIDGMTVRAKGKLGENVVTLTRDVTIRRDEDRIVVEPAHDTQRARVMWGTSRALINNLIKGVDEGFTVILDLVGVGYRAQVDGRTLVLQLGYSHDVRMSLPDGVAAKCERPTNIVLTSHDKQVLGQFASEVRAKRPPEPYKGKGVKYANEYIFRKEGKKK